MDGMLQDANSFFFAGWSLNIFQVYSWSYLSRWATTGSQEREPGNHPSEIVVFIPFHPSDFDVLYPIY